MRVIRQHTHTHTMSDADRWNTQYSTARKKALGAVCQLEGLLAELDTIQKRSGLGDKLVGSARTNMRESFGLVQVSSNMVETEAVRIFDGEKRANELRAQQRSERNATESDFVKILLAKADKNLLAMIFGYNSLLVRDVCALRCACTSTARVACGSDICIAMHRASGKKLQVAIQRPIGKVVCGARTVSDGWSSPLSHVSAVSMNVYARSVGGAHSVPAVVVRAVSVADGRKRTPPSLPISVADNAAAELENAMGDQENAPSCGGGVPGADGPRAKAVCAYTPVPKSRVASDVSWTRICVGDQSVGVRNAYCKQDALQRASNLIHYRDDSRDENTAEVSVVLRVHGAARDAAITRLRLTTDVVAGAELSSTCIGVVCSTREAEKGPWYPRVWLAAIGNGDGNGPRGLRYYSLRFYQVSRVSEQLVAWPALATMCSSVRLVDNTGRSFVAPPVSVARADVWGRRRSTPTVRRSSTTAVCSALRRGEVLMHTYSVAGQSILRVCAGETVVPGVRLSFRPRALPGHPAVASSAVLEATVAWPDIMQTLDKRWHWKTRGGSAHGAAYGEVPTVCSLLSTAMFTSAVPAVSASRSDSPRFGAAADAPPETTRRCTVAQLLQTHDMHVSACIGAYDAHEECLRACANVTWGDDAPLVARLSDAVIAPSDTPEPGIVATEADDPAAWFINPPSMGTHPDSRPTVCFMTMFRGVLEHAVDCNPGPGHITCYVAMGKEVRAVTVSGFRTSCTVADVEHALRDWFAQRGVSRVSVRVAGPEVDKSACYLKTSMCASRGWGQLRERLLRDVETWAAKSTSDSGHDSAGSAQQDRQYELVTQVLRHMGDFSRRGGCNKGLVGTHFGGVVCFASVSPWWERSVRLFDVKSTDVDVPLTCGQVAMLEGLNEHYRGRSFLSPVTAGGACVMHSAVPTGSPNAVHGSVFAAQLGGSDALLQEDLPFGELSISMAPDETAALMPGVTNRAPTTRVIKRNTVVPFVYDLLYN